LVLQENDRGKKDKTWSAAVAQSVEHLTTDHEIKGLIQMALGTTRKWQREKDKTWSAAVGQYVDHLTTDHEIKGLNPDAGWHWEKMT
jgi:hypothetical protein